MSLVPSPGRWAYCRTPRPHPVGQKVSCDGGLKVDAGSPVPTTEADRGVWTAAQLMLASLSAWLTGACRRRHGGPTHESVC